MYMRTGVCRPFERFIIKLGWCGQTSDAAYLQYSLCIFIVKFHFFYFQMYYYIHSFYQKFNRYSIPKEKKYIFVSGCSNILFVILYSNTQSMLNSHRKNLFLFLDTVQILCMELTKIQSALNPRRKKYIFVSVYSDSMVCMKLRKKSIELDPHQFFFLAIASS